MSRDTITIDPAYRSRLEFARLATVADVLQAPDSEVVAWSRSTDTSRIGAESGAPGFFLKRYFYSTWSKRLRSAFRGAVFGPHRAKSEARLLNQMQHNGLNAVRAVAHGTRRRLGCVEASFLITEEVPGAQNLSTFARAVEHGAPLLNRAFMIDELAAHIARMHSLGFCHGQLFWRNILVAPSCAQQFTFYLLDVRPGCGFRRVGRRSNWWIDELAQLTASSVPHTTERERLAFLRGYAHERNLSTPLRVLRDEIETRTQPWIAREATRAEMSDRFEQWRTTLSREAKRIGVLGEGSA